MDFKCNLCGGRSIKEIYPATVTNSSGGYACTNDAHGQYFRLVRCSRCGLYFSHPRPTAAELAKEYSRLSDERYKQELAGRVLTFKRNLTNLAQYKSAGDLLDVGAALGVFVNQARKQGYAAVGIEPSWWCVKEAKKLFGLKLRQGTDKDLNRLGRKFDVVTLWDVLEHVDNPLATLKRLRRALKPGGILAFSTVDIGSGYARLLGRRWPWLMTMHLYYFDKTTIKKYLAKTGFKLLALKKYHHTISLDYLLYKLNKISRHLYWLVKTMKRVFLFNRNFYITFGLGDFMEVYAKKR